MSEADYILAARAAEPTLISYDAAMRLLEGYQADIDLFLEELGERNEYDARAVLRWLGL